MRAACWGWNADWGGGIDAGWICSFVVMSATVEKLVAHLEEDHAAGPCWLALRTAGPRPPARCWVAHAGPMPVPVPETIDTNYVTDFLLMFRTFIAPDALLAMLVSRFQAVSAGSTLTPQQTRIRNKCVRGRRRRRSTLPGTCMWADAARVHARMLGSWPLCGCGSCTTTSTLRTTPTS